MNGKNPISITVGTVIGPTNVGIGLTVFHLQYRGMGVLSVIGGTVDGSMESYFYQFSTGFS